MLSAMRWHFFWMPVYALCNAVPLYMQVMLARPWQMCGPAIIMCLVDELQVTTQCLYNVCKLK